MAKLTKRDIVVAISDQTGMVQHQVFDVVQRTLDHITDSLANNVAVELRNFGVFQPRLTKPRVGRNPNEPGSSFVIPARATVKFKPGKIMRQRVEKSVAGIEGCLGKESRGERPVYRIARKSLENPQAGLVPVGERTECRVGLEGVLVPIGAMVLLQLPIAWMRTGAVPCSVALHRQTGYYRFFAFIV